MRQSTTRRAEIKLHPIWLVLAILPASAFLVAVPSTASAQQCDPIEFHKLLAPDGAANDHFGWSVGISGTVAIVGANQHHDNGVQSGSAYLFDTTTSQLIAKLLPNDGALEDYFGHAVGISATIAIVGVYGDDDNGEDSGSAYLFNTATGKQIAKLLPNDGAADDWFGWSVAISGTTAIVGARRDDDSGLDSGSAYLFDTATGVQIAKLLPNDGAADDWFGWSVAISGTTAIVGAHGDDLEGSISQAGSAYVFDIPAGQQIAKPQPRAVNDDDK